MKNRERKLWMITVLLLIVGLMIGIAWAAKWSDYGELAQGGIAADDTFMVLDASDPTLAATGTQKQYKWSSLIVDLPAAIAEGGLADSIVVSADIKDGTIDHADMDGSYISQTPMSDDCDNFLANFTGDYLYGGTFLCSTTGTCTLPAVTAGMHFTIITVGDIECIIDPNANDSMLTDGTQQTDGKNITNTSSAGDIAVVQYLSAAGWLVSTNGWTQEAE